MRKAAGNQLIEVPFRDLGAGAISSKYFRCGIIIIAKDIFGEYFGVAALLGKLADARIFLQIPRDARCICQSKNVNFPLPHSFWGDAGASGGAALHGVTFWPRVSVGGWNVWGGARLSSKYSLMLDISSPMSFIFIWGRIEEHRKRSSCPKKNSPIWSVQGSSELPPCPRLCSHESAKTRYFLYYRHRNEFFLKKCAEWAWFFQKEW